MGRASKARVAAVYPDRAGIDIAKDIRHAALPAGRQGEQPAESFGATTGELHRLADWLEAHSIRQVAPESTGVCRIAPCEVLERRGFEAGLADPVGLARPDRRKSDVPDCRRLQQPTQWHSLKEKGAFT